MASRLAPLALLALCTAAVAGDWPGYLGPHRTGVSDEAGVVSGWKDGTRVLWRAPLGPGYASVAVVGGVVYAMTSTAEEDQVVALDAATGREKWRARVGPYFKDVQGFDGSRATPTVVGDRVVALGGHGGLVVLDRDSGARVWAVDIVNTLGGQMPRWGFSASPLVDDGKVYLSTGGGDKDGIVALSLADGSVVWKRPTEGGAGYASPIRATLGGVDQIVFFTGYGPVGASPADGTVLWKHPWVTNYEVNAATPVVLGSNRLFVASGYGVGGAALLIDESAHVSELWRTKKMKNKTSTSILLDGTLYGFNESRLTALDANTGEERWSDESYGRGTLIAAEKHLLVLAEDCTASLLEPTPTGPKAVGAPVKVLEHGPCWTTPALAGGVLYVRDGTEVVAVEVRPVGPMVD
ncbi:MAG: PQQ-like beta-propeller repeat protein [Alphaproteobacteria bacterium]|nr:PQQ-like beta-propeller repeat protein [Alphaproteobacteria bacterium]